MKQILAYSSPAGKIFYLFLFSFIGLLIGSGFLILFESATQISAANNIWGIYMGILVQSIFAFIVPAWFVVAWSKSSPCNYFRLKASSQLPNMMFFGVFVFAASYLFISFLTQWNKTIQLPEALLPIEEWMRAMEDSAMATTERLLSGKSVIDLLANLFFIALMAAVSEEIFFRGALQQFLQEMTKNGHAAVWISSFIFSAIHLQFYGFFPRLMLGALLGYLFLYTRNLWVPIIVHFVNNSLVILLTYFWGDADWFNKMEDIPVTPTLFVLALLSAIITVVLFRLYKQPEKLEI